MDNLISYLNNIPSELLLFIEFLSCFLVLATMTKFFKLLGVYVFIVFSMLIANIQVLKVVEFGFYPQPIALGKIMICFSFLATDLITECYDKQIAKTGIWLGFTCNFLFILLMLITIGYKPYTDQITINLHEPIKQIFLPLPSIFLSGLAAYLLGQFIDVQIYSKLKQKFQHYLWLKAFIATGIGSLIDNAFFYTMAFYILNPNPIPLESLFYTYIIGTYIFRIIIIFCSSFLLILLKGILVKSPIKLKNSLILAGQE